MRSRQFKAIGYDWKTHALEVEFRQGQLYRYYDVPDSVYYALMASVSKDSFFDATIHRRYAFRRVR